MRSSLSWVRSAVAIGAGVLVVLVFFLSWMRGTDTPGEIARPHASDRSARQGGVSSDPPGSTAPTSISFDVVRIEPSGDSVIAGRALPNATVDLLDNGTAIVRVVADASGAFAILPPALAPGTHELTLLATVADGSRVQSSQSVTVIILPDGNQQPLVTVSAPDRATVVLSQPNEPNPTQRTVAGGLQGGKTDIRIAAVDSQGESLFVSGAAAPGATIRLYLNDSLISSGKAAADGSLSFAMQTGVRAGQYRIRVDEVDPVSGTVRSRAEVPFTVAEPAIASSTAISAASSPTTPVRPERSVAGEQVIVPKVNTAQVTRGDNLWRISKRIYGEGLRYTIIFGANSPQIRSPDLIYPGQVFVLPSQPISSLPQGRPKT